jgi:hypothetical protein
MPAKNYIYDGKIAEWTIRRTPHVSQAYFRFWKEGKVERVVRIYRDNGNELGRSTTFFPAELDRFSEGSKDSIRIPIENIRDRVLAFLLRGEKAQLSLEEASNYPNRNGNYPTIYLSDNFS